MSFKLIYYYLLLITANWQKSNHLLLINLKITLNEFQITVPIWFGSIPLITALINTNKMYGYNKKYYDQ